jgi:hypothetical protein
MLIIDVKLSGEAKLPPECGQPNDVAGTTCMWNEESNYVMHRAKPGCNCNKKWIKEFSITRFY